MEDTRLIVTRGGYRIAGSGKEVVQAAEKSTGRWTMRSLCELGPTDLVMLPLGQLTGEARQIPLPVLDQAYYADDQQLRVPDELTSELAELVGYFMGDGSLHAKGIRLCVANTDPDVIERLSSLGTRLFHLEPVIRKCQGYVEVTLQSVRLARWWQAAGFAKRLPDLNHRGKGWKPHVPGAVLESNNKRILSGFVRGLFEADGTVLESVPSFSTSCAEFAGDVRSLLLTLGMVTTTRITTSGYGSTMHQVRLRNLDHAIRFGQDIGFLSARKSALIDRAQCRQAGNRDRIYLPRPTWEQVVPFGDRYRSVVISSLSKSGGVSRHTSAQIALANPDPRLLCALQYVFEEVGASTTPVPDLPRRPGLRSDRRAIFSES